MHICAYILQSTSVNLKQDFKKLEAFQSSAHLFHLLHVKHCLEDISKKFQRLGHSVPIYFNIFSKTGCQLPFMLLLPC